MHSTNLRMPDALAAVVARSARRSERSKNKQIVYLVRRGLEAEGISHDRSDDALTGAAPPSTDT